MSTKGVICEIYSPLLDRHNDRLCAYMTNNKVTDDFYTLKNLEISGVEVSRHVIAEIIGRHEVSEMDGELYFCHKGTAIDGTYKRREDQLFAAMHEISNLRSE